MRFVKRLVVGLTATMIVGIAVIVGLLALRLSAPPAPLALPDQLALPEGVRAEAVTLTRAQVLVVTDTNALLVFDRATGSLQHSIALPPLP